MLDRRVNTKRVLLIGLLLLSFGCASIGPAGAPTTIGDKKFHYLVGRTGAAAGPTMCMMNLISTDLQDKNSKVEYSATANTGGALDSVFSTGKLISIGAMTNTFGGVP